MQCSSSNQIDRIIYNLNHQKSCSRIYTFLLFLGKCFARIVGRIWSSNSVLKISGFTSSQINPYLLYPFKVSFIYNVSTSQKCKILLTFWTIFTLTYGTFILFYGVLLNLYRGERGQESAFFWLLSIKQRGEGKKSLKYACVIYEWPFKLVYLP